MNTVNYLVNDEMTLRELKIAQWQIVVRLIAAAGLTFTLVSSLVYFIDTQFNKDTFSKGLVEHLKNL